MKLSQLKINFTTALQGVYDKEEVHCFFFMLCDFFLQYSRFEVSISQDTVVSETNIARFEKVLLRLKTQEPIQYILGTTEFYGLTFKVNKNTLIPRPETEELVDWVLSNLHDKDRVLEILDIGTGSGCIAISLAKNIPTARVSGLDISEKTLEVAQDNAVKNQVLVSFFKKDILETTALKNKYDVMVSNPPYVRQLEKKAMKANVLDYEPGLALFVPNEDPLLFYRKIAQLAMVSLQTRGWLYFEINEYLSKEMDVLLKDIGFANIEIKKDFREVPRMIKCQKL